MVKIAKKRVAADTAPTNPDEEQASRFPAAQKLSPVTPSILNQVAIEGFDHDDNMSADANGNDDLDGTAVAQVCHFRRRYRHCQLHGSGSGSVNLSSLDLNLCSRYRCCMQAQNCLLSQRACFTASSPLIKQPADQ